MAGWHHQCNGHELGQTLGGGEGQETWHAAVHGVAKSDMTGQLNNINTVNFQALAPLTSCEKSKTCSM